MAGARTTRDQLVLGLGVANIESLWSSGYKVPAVLGNDCRHFPVQSLDKKLGFPVGNQTLQTLYGKKKKTESKSAEES